MAPHWGAAAAATAGAGAFGGTYGGGGSTGGGYGGGGVGGSAPGDAWVRGTAGAWAVEAGTAGWGADPAPAHTVPLHYGSALGGAGWGAGGPVVRAWEANPPLTRSDWLLPGAAAASHPYAACLPTFPYAHAAYAAGPPPPLWHPQRSPVLLLPPLRTPSPLLEPLLLLPAGAPSRGPSPPLVLRHDPWSAAVCEQLLSPPPSPDPEPAEDWLPAEPLQPASPNRGAYPEPLPLLSPLQPTRTSRQVAAAAAAAVAVARAELRHPTTRRAAAGVVQGAPGAAAWPYLSDLDLSSTGVVGRVLPSPGAGVEDSESPERLPTRQPTPQPSEAAGAAGAAAAPPPARARRRLSWTPPPGAEGPQADAAEEAAHPAANAPPSGKRRRFMSDPALHLSAPAEAGRGARGGPAGPEPYAAREAPGAGRRGRLTDPGVGGAAGAGAGAAGARQQQQRPPAAARAKAQQRRLRGRGPRLLGPEPTSSEGSAGSGPPSQEAAEAHAAVPQGQRPASAPAAESRQEDAAARAEPLGGHPGEGERQRPSRGGIFRLLREAASPSPRLDRGQRSQPAAQHQRQAAEEDEEGEESEEPGGQGLGQAQSPSGSWAPEPEQRWQPSPQRQGSEEQLLPGLGELLEALPQEDQQQEGGDGGSEGASERALGVGHVAGGGAQAQAPAQAAGPLPAEQRRGPRRRRGDAARERAVADGRYSALPLQPGQSVLAGSTSGPGSRPRSRQRSEERSGAAGGPPPPPPTRPPADGQRGGATGLAYAPPAAIQRPQPIAHGAIGAGPAAAAGEEADPVEATLAPAGGAGVAHAGAGVGARREPAGRPLAASAEEEADADPVEATLEPVRERAPALGPREPPEGRQARAAEVSEAAPALAHGPGAGGTFRLAAAAPAPALAAGPIAAPEGAAAPARQRSPSPAPSPPPPAPSPPRPVPRPRPPRPNALVALMARLAASDSQDGLGPESRTDGSGPGHAGPRSGPGHDSDLGPSQCPPEPGAPAGALLGQPVPWLGLVVGATDVRTEQGLGGRAGDGDTGPGPSGAGPGLVRWEQHSAGQGRGAEAAGAGGLLARDHLGQAGLQPGGAEAASVTGQGALPGLPHLGAQRPSHARAEQEQVAATAGPAAGAPMAVVGQAEPAPSLPLQQALVQGGTTPMVEAPQQRPLPPELRWTPPAAPEIEELLGAPRHQPQHPLVASPPGPPPQAAPQPQSPQSPVLPQQPPSPYVPRSPWLEFVPQSQLPPPSPQAHAQQPSPHPHPHPQPSPAQPLPPTGQPLLQPQHLQPSPAPPLGLAQAQTSPPAPPPAQLQPPYPHPLAHPQPHPHPHPHPLTGPTPPPPLQLQPRWPLPSPHHQPTWPAEAGPSTAPASGAAQPRPREGAGAGASGRSGAGPLTDHDLGPLQPWQAECLRLRGVAAGSRALLLCAAAGSGRSRLGELLALRRLGETGRPFLWVAPYNALCAERAHRLEAALGAAGGGWRLRRAYAGLGGQPGRPLEQGLGAVVATPERAAVLLAALAEGGRLAGPGGLGAVVVEDVHMVGEGERGALVELLLTRLRELSGAGAGGGAGGHEGPAPPPQLVALSAPLSPPDAALLAGWLGAALHCAPQRPVPLRQFVKVGRSVLDPSGQLVRTLAGPPPQAQAGPGPPAPGPGPGLWSEAADPDHVALLAGEALAAGGSVLVLCGTRAACAEVAASAASLLHIPAPPGPPPPPPAARHTAGAGAGVDASGPGPSAGPSGAPPPQPPQPPQAPPAPGPLELLDWLDDDTAWQGGSPGCPGRGGAAGGGGGGGGGGGAGGGAPPALSRGSVAAALRALPGADPALPGLVERGVGFHHAGLSMAERRLMEAAFRPPGPGLGPGPAAPAPVRLLAATTSLALGVRLPASRLLLRGTRTGNRPLDAASFHAMAERAGWVGPDPCAELYVLVPASEAGGGGGGGGGGGPGEAAALALVRSPAPPLRSALGKVEGGLARLVLETLYCRGPGGASEEELRSALAASLQGALRGREAAQAAAQAAGGGGGGGGGGAGAPVPDPLWPGARAALQGLAAEDHGLARRDPASGRWHATPFGTALAACLLGPSPAGVGVRGALQAVADLRRCRAAGPLLAEGAHLCFLATRPEEDLGVDWGVAWRLWQGALRPPQREAGRRLGVDPDLLRRLAQGQGPGLPPPGAPPDPAARERPLRRFLAALALSDLLDQVPPETVIRRLGLGGRERRGDMEALRERCGEGGEGVGRGGQARLAHGGEPPWSALAAVRGVGPDRARALAAAGLAAAEDVAAASPARLAAALGVGLLTAARLRRAVADDVADRAREMEAVAGDMRRRAGVGQQGLEQGLGQGGGQAGAAAGPSAAAEPSPLPAPPGAATGGASGSRSRPGPGGTPLQAGPSAPAPAPAAPPPVHPPQRSHSPEPGASAWERGRGRGREEGGDRGQGVGAAAAGATVAGGEPRPLPKRRRLFPPSPHGGSEGEAGAALGPTGGPTGGGDAVAPQGAPAGPLAAPTFAALFRGSGSASGGQPADRHPGPRSEPVPVPVSGSGDIIPGMFQGTGAPEYMPGMGVALLPPTQPVEELTMALLPPLVPRPPPTSPPPSPAFIPATLPSPVAASPAPPPTAFAGPAATPLFATSHTAVHPSPWPSGQAAAAPVSPQPQPQPHPSARMQLGPLLDAAAPAPPTTAAGPRVPHSAGAALRTPPAQQGPAPSPGSLGLRSGAAQRGPRGGSSGRRPPSAPAPPPAPMRPFPPLPLQRVGPGGSPLLRASLGHAALRTPAGAGAGLVGTALPPASGAAAAAGGSTWLSPSPSPHTTHPPQPQPLAGTLQASVPGPTYAFPPSVVTAADLLARGAQAGPSPDPALPGPMAPAIMVPPPSIPGAPPPAPPGPASPPRPPYPASPGGSHPASPPLPLLSVPGFSLVRGAGAAAELRRQLRAAREWGFALDFGPGPVDAAAAGGGAVGAAGPSGGGASGSGARSRQPAWAAAALPRSPPPLLAGVAFSARDGCGVYLPLAPGPGPGAGAPAGSVLAEAEAAAGLAPGPGAEGGGGALSEVEAAAAVGEVASLLAEAWEGAGAGAGSGSGPGSYWRVTAELKEQLLQAHDALRLHPAHRLALTLAEAAVAAVEEAEAAAEEAEAEAEAEAAAEAGAEAVQGAERQRAPAEGPGQAAASPPPPLLPLPLTAGPGVVDVRLALWAADPADPVALGKGGGGTREARVTCALEERLAGAAAALQGGQGGGQGQARGRGGAVGTPARESSLPPSLSPAGSTALAVALGAMGRCGCPSRLLPPRQTDACRRAALARRLWTVLQPRLQADGLLPSLLQLEAPLVPLLAGMEAAGVGLDTQALSAQRQPLVARLAEASEALRRAAGRGVDPTSQKDVSRLLFTELGLAPPDYCRRMPGGWHSVNKQALLLLLTSAPPPLRPLVAALAEARALAAALQCQAPLGEAAAAALEAAGITTGFVRGRLSSWEQTSSCTGRLEHGLQVLPTPRELPLPLSGGQGPPLRPNPRAGVAAPPGCVLLSGDYSQLELRLVAALSGDPVLGQLLGAGAGGGGGGGGAAADAFVLLAAQWKGLQPHQVTPEMRAAAKRSVYGILYGQGVSALAAEAGVGLAEAAAMAGWFKRAVSVLGEWRQQVVAACRRQGFVTSLAGRRRYLPDITSPDSAARAAAERQAVNSLVQGSAADVAKGAMLELGRRLRGRGLAGRARLVLMVHDELLVEVEATALPAAAGALAGAMQAQAGRLAGAARAAVPLPAALAVGPSWGQLAPYAPPAPLGGGPGAA
ncbi:hypothetical protein HYH03_009282 [Edaphochlamys debaryana]|uniref:DNA-directed DNA polymerase n=1 Tax=Edaphochlamys debaryana TaxID=47281 RepID=A0A835XY51_9CHLO|nr:hypothetical protein HYH03_009282 [Edaphochlamys debaryana]|eukprot:KAG2492331.1 hypothetical protein HYH03_009282 [Edaphochlamys debaryana]